MVSKNNRIRRMEEVAGRQSHFGIRKLTVGAASVLLGITLLFGANAKVARADGSPGNGSTNEVVNPAEGSTPNVNSEQQGEKPAADEATDEEATAYKKLKSAIEQARNTKGLTVSGPYDSKPGDNAHIPDELDKSKVGVIYDNEKLSAEDMQKQADEIQKKISTYVEKRKEFIQGLKEQGIYKDGDVDPTTLAQHLILQSEPQARSEYKIQDNKGNWITADKNDVVTVTRDPNAPFVNDTNNPSVNPAYAVHLKNNNQVTRPIIQMKNNNQVTRPIIQITYTNLKNSEYDGKPLGKIVETFSTDINDSKAAFYISTNPTNGWLYTDCNGITATIQLYDNQDDPQLIKIDSSAYVSVSSLNSNGLTFTSNGETIIKGRTEAAQLLSTGSAMSIPESSVQVFPGNKVLSPSDNEDLLYNKTHNKDQINYWGKFFAPREADWNKLSPDQQEDEIQKVGNYVINNYSDWDNTGSRKIFGSALYKVEENPIVIRSYVIRNSSNPIRGYWFTYSTTVPQTSFDAINTINYHFATAHSVTDVGGSQTVEYIDGKTKQRISEKDYPDKIQRVTFTVANGTVTDKSGNKYNVKRDTVTNKIVKVNSKTGEITDLTDKDNVIYNWTWNTNGKYGNASQVTADNVDVPKINGYIASIDTEIVSTEKNTTQPGKIVPIKDKNGKETGKYVVPGNSISVDNPTTVVKVIYNQLGHIIPVYPDPTDPTKPGQTIPNVDHPQYPTDPTDPTKVKPDTPIPKITGWHIAKNPDPGKTPGTVTPKDPTKDTLVIFAKDQYAQIFYRDVNDPKNIITLDMSPEVTGTAGDPITFGDKDNPTNKITRYENKGYVLVNDEFDSGKPIFDSNNGIQIFNIDFKHGTTPVTPDKPQKPDDPINPNDPDGPKWPKGTTADDLTRKATQTITYKYSDGSKPDTTKVENQDKAFTKTVTVDNVTGEIIKQTDWTPADYKFDTVDTPRVDGYHADKKQAGGKLATPDHPNVYDTVVYTPNGHIIPVDPDGNPIPGIPEEPYVTDPNDPTKVVPDENVPKDPNGKYTPDKDTVIPEDPSQDTPVFYNPIPKVPGPSDNTPTLVTPTPGKITEEKKPEETKPDETKLDENKDDKDVNEPDDDEDFVPTPRHHKKHNGGESSTTRSRPTGYTPAPKGRGYLDANGKVHYKLPQTGESNSEEMVAFLGGVAAAIGLIGLAGAKKRRHE